MVLTAIVVALEFDLVGHQLAVGVGIGFHLDGIADLDVALDLGAGVDEQGLAVDGPLGVADGLNRAVELDLLAIGHLGVLGGLDLTGHQFALGIENGVHLDQITHDERAVDFRLRGDQEGKAIHHPQPVFHAVDGAHQLKAAIGG